VVSTGAVPPRLARPIAIGGLVFFIEALLYFAWRYLSAFAREVPGAIDARAIVIDVTLFSIFALHHSLFARDTIRKRITRLVGALERSAYVWIASAMFIAVCAWWRPVAGMAWRIDQPVPRWLVLAAQLVGVWLTIWSAMAIDLLELSGVKQADRAGGPSGEIAEFKAAGPYGWVRHPIYLGWFLLVFATPTMTMTKFVFAVTSGVYLLIAIPLEERSLRRASNGAYDRYMREVRWKLVPHVF